MEQNIAMKLRVGFYGNAVGSERLASLFNQYAFQLFFQDDPVVPE